ncbi:MAG: hypothetical protein QF512_20190, partial [Alphaproteobacteria bacterium]|nr:hypothetical protein [Alphaproteobacteria bacterium]
QTRQNSLNHPERMGDRVMTYGDWYYLPDRNYLRVSKQQTGIQIRRLLWRELHPALGEAG